LGIEPTHTEDFRVELVEGVEPLLLWALQMATDDQCPFWVRAALYSYRANTAYRGMLVNNLLVEQIKFVFSSMAPDTINDDGLRELCGYTVEQWRNIRHASKGRLASSKGFLSLHQAVELLQRPTYFKQVLVRETNIIDQLPSKERLSQIQSVMVDGMLEYGLTKQEYIDRFPLAKQAWDDANRVFNADSWRIQTDSKLVQETPHVVMESFQTVPWKGRRKNILRNLVWYLENNSPFSTTPDPEKLLKVVNGSAPTYIDDLYVSRARFSGLCSLETPLY
jgi:hypothetical protein